MKEQTVYAEECNQLGMPLSLEYYFSAPLHFWDLISNHLNVKFSGVNLKSLVHAADSYQSVLAENRKLFNEVQELKGRIIHVLILVYYVSGL